MVSFFFNWVVVTPLSNISWPCKHEYVSRLLITFLWSMYLYMCHHHIVLIVIFCNIVWNKEMWAPCFVLLSQNFFGYSGSFGSKWILGFCFYFCTNGNGLSIWIALKIQMALGNLNILTMLVLTIHEHRISFYLLVLSSNFFHRCLIVLRVEISHILS